MNEKIKKAFDQIQAEEGLKGTTKEYLSQKIRQRSSGRSRAIRRILPVMACFLMGLLGVGGYHMYFTPVSVISIDINPSIEWSLNQFDRIIAVENYNEDGEKLSDTLDVNNKSYSEALELLMENSLVEEYLNQDEYLTITVVGEDKDKSEQMLETTRACTSGIQNVYCAEADYSELQAAHETGLSCGKYRFYLVLQSLDPSITTEEIQQMTMREIRDRINTLSDKEGLEESGTHVPSQGNQGQGAGNGLAEQRKHRYGQE